MFDPAMLEPRPNPASPIRYPLFFGLPRLATAFVGTALVTGSNFAAQFLASAAGALLLDPLNRLRPNLGYHGLVVAIEIFFLVGAVGLARIRLDEFSKEVMKGKGAW